MTADALLATRTDTAPDRRTRRPTPTLAVVGVSMIALVVLFCLLYPLTPWYDAYGQDLENILLPPFQEAAHWLGTDSLGRDVASRLALGGRVTLAIITGIIVVNSIVGMVVGTIAGYAGGTTDNALMAVADVQLALPVVLVLIALSASLGPSVWLMVIVLAATYWVGYARVARAVALSLREREFVIAPKLQGARATWTLRKHVLPTVLSQVLILASADVGALILLTSSFDFLGLGVQAPTPSWGLMISEGQKYLRQDPALAIIPGVAIFLVVGGANLVSQQFTSENAPARRRRPKGGRR